MVNLCGVKFGESEAFKTICLLVPDHPEPYDFTSNNLDKLFTYLRKSELQLNGQIAKLFARFDQQQVREAKGKV